MQEKLFIYLVTGGGIIALSQLAKNYIPIGFGKLKAGAVWAALLSLVASVLGYDGAWDINAILPVLGVGAGYWLTAHGIYKVATDKAKQTQEHALDLLEILEGVIVEDEELEGIPG